MESQLQVLLPELLLLYCVHHDEGLSAHSGAGESLEARNLLGRRVPGDGTYYDDYHKGLAQSVVPGGTNHPLVTLSFANQSLDLLGLLGHP